MITVEIKGKKEVEKGVQNDRNKMLKDNLRMQMIRKTINVINEMMKIRIRKRRILKKSRGNKQINK